jgi:S-adenosylmethionine synthetase
MRQVLSKYPKEFKKRFPESGEDIKVMGSEPTIA